MWMHGKRVVAFGNGNVFARNICIVDGNKCILQLETHPIEEIDVVHGKRVVAFKKVKFSIEVTRN